MKQKNKQRRRFSYTNMYVFLWSQRYVIYFSFWFLSANFSNNYIICVPPPSTTLINFRSKLNSLNMPDRVNCLSFARRRQAAKLIIRGGSRPTAVWDPRQGTKGGLPPRLTAPLTSRGVTRGQKWQTAAWEMGRSSKHSNLFCGRQLWEIHKLKERRCRAQRLYFTNILRKNETL